jgi:hypothetical protein
MDGSYAVFPAKPLDRTNARLDIVMHVTLAIVGVDQQSLRRLGTCK